MVRLREVGTLWIGGTLSWMEQLSLKSFVDRGQKITLFHYHPIPNIPDGVIVRDGREVLDTDDFIKYENKNSYALFADYFRIHMIAKNPGMIWVDTDVYCHRVMDYDSDYVMAFELYNTRRVNNAVLGLPADSAIVRDILEFMSDPYAIPPFVREPLREAFRQAAALGNPVHVSQQPWGVWGPTMLSYFVAKHGLKKHVLPRESFYPIPFSARRTMLHSPEVVEPFLTPETTALHLWASNKRELGIHVQGLPGRNSYLAKIVERHGINVYEAPIATRANRVFAAGLVDRLPHEKAAVFAAMPGCKPMSMLRAYHRWGAQIDLIDLLPDGSWSPTPSKWAEQSIAFLHTAGLPADKLRLVCQSEDLRPADVVFNVAGFGRSYRITPALPVFNTLLQTGSTVLTDLAKGKKGYLYFRRLGHMLDQTHEHNQPAGVEQVVVFVGRKAADISTIGSTEAEGEPEKDKAPAASPVQAADAGDEGGAEQLLSVGEEKPESTGEEKSEPWSVIATRLAGSEGFYREGAEHAMLYIQRSPKTLVVTFDNLDLAMEKRADRRPWGYAFIEKLGYSMLGLTAAGWTWFRDPWVYAQFDQLRDEGFFKQFERVVFYGASMGGYGACAFSAASPGASVVALSPQSTLDRKLVPFETRYQNAWGRDYSGPYGDAAVASQTASNVMLFYDPYVKLDAQHVARFTGGNVQRLRAPLLGHRLGSGLNRIGILSPLMQAALKGELSEEQFYQTLRLRRDNARYQTQLFERAVEKGHPKLAVGMARSVLERGSHRRLRLLLKAQMERGRQHAEG